VRFSRAHAYLGVVGCLCLIALAAEVLLRTLSGQGVRPQSGGGEAEGQKRDTPALRRLGRVFLIVMENRGYSEVLNNPDAPYLRELASRYGLAEQYRAIAHPSLPNYLALIAGDTFGVRSNCTECFFDEPNLADELEAHGKTWKSYQEDLPFPCFLGEQSGGYVLRHNPFLYFEKIRADRLRCQRVVPLGQLKADLDSGGVPDLAWITPNLLHDMHDGSIAQGDQWLAGLVPSILSSSAWQQNGLLVIVWDESSSLDTVDGGHIPALFIAPDARPGTRSSAPASHYHLLRTLEEGWGLSYLGHSGDPDVQPISDLVPMSAGT
jgi:phosphatidylinositol-3-phosphatase